VDKLRAICDPGLTTDLLEVLTAHNSIGRITHHKLVDPSSSRDVPETEVQDHSAHAVLQMLARNDKFQAVDIYLRPIQDVEHYRFEPGRPVAIEDEVEAINISVGSREFRRLIRVDYEYILLMSAAAVVATAGLIGDLPIAVIGAMAFSPDLGRLNAIAFAVITGEWRLLMWGRLTDPLGAIPDLLVNYVTVLDGVTVTVALGAGIAAMIVFISDRGRAAVGVGVSITTIPAAACAGIAFADGNWSSGWDALVVLGVNIVCVIVAGVVTGVVLRRHLEHRARALGDSPLSNPA
jgi:hypothetical protein